MESPLSPPVILLPCFVDSIPCWLFPNPTCVETLYYNELFLSSYLSPSSSSSFLSCICVDWISANLLDKYLYCWHGISSLAPILPNHSWEHWKCKQCCFHLPSSRILCSAHLFKHLPNFILGVHVSCYPHNDNVKIPYTPQLTPQVPQSSSQSFKSFNSVSVNFQNSFM